MANKKNDESLMKFREDAWKNYQKQQKATQKKTTKRAKKK